MSLDLIEMWHKNGRPDPTEQEFTIQLGCHIEEFVEMMTCLSLLIDKENAEIIISAVGVMDALAGALKEGAADVKVINRGDFLDSLADQIVTAVGVGHCAGMNVPEACLRVNQSNWSKYDYEGKPIFNENGKIAKGPHYKAPDLQGLF